MRKESEKKPECILGTPGKGRAYHPWDDDYDTWHFRSDVPLEELLNDRYVRDYRQKKKPEAPYASESLLRIETGFREGSSVPFVLLVTDGIVALNLLFASEKKRKVAADALVLLGACDSTAQLRYGEGGRKGFNSRTGSAVTTVPRLDADETYMLWSFKTDDGSNDLYIITENCDGCLMTVCQKTPKELRSDPDFMVLSKAYGAAVTMYEDCLKWYKDVRKA